MHWFTITFFISSLTSLTAAISICSSGIYSKLAPLSTYKPAQSYCSAHFPVPTATVTSTVTVTQLAKRTALHGRNTPKKHTTANLSSCYSSLKGAVSSIAKTLCSCIETGATSTVTITATQNCVGTFPPTITGPSGFVYHEFYDTYGAREPQPWPENPNDSASGEHFGEGASCNDVLQFCANNADWAGDKSFNLFNSGDGDWICLTYKYQQTAANAVDFNYVNPSIHDSSGWSQ